MEHYMDATIVPTFGTFMIQWVEYIIFCLHERYVHNYMTNIDSDVEIMKLIHAILELHGLRIEIIATNQSFCLQAQLHSHIL